MTEKELFAQRAAAGYTVCYAPQCPCREHCLRWRVGQEMPDSTNFYSAVNPRAQGVCTAECPHYRPSEKVRFAKGMTQTFNDDMPRRIVEAVRGGIIARHCKTYYYEFRKGQRLIPPAIQEEIRGMFRQAGWDKEIDFDGYIEDYDW